MDTRNDKIITPNKNYFSSKMWAKEREDTTYISNVELELGLQGKEHTTSENYEMIKMLSFKKDNKN